MCGKKNLVIFETLYKIAKYYSMAHFQIYFIPL